MIPFFRKIRKKLAEDNRPGKYLRYAIGEIVLVVIGILIAIQINNWNQERIQQEELNGLLQNLANGVQSDLRSLNLLSTARESIAGKSDSIFRTYINSDIDSLSIQEAAFIALAFEEINTPIYFNPNVSAFQSLQNSTYLGEIQGTDLAVLLSNYYISAAKIKDLEELYNQSSRKILQDWIEIYRDRGARLFFSPGSFFDEFNSHLPNYFEILRDS